MERYPHAFSGGQRQRIGIARALALDPRIIIADEATSALDVSIRSQILDLLLELQKRLDLSFIFISHDIGVVRYFCDRVAVMHRGRIVEIGDGRDRSARRPTHPYTKALISAVPNPDPRQQAHAGAHPPRNLKQPTEGHSNDGQSGISRSRRHGLPDGAASQAPRATT